MNDRRVMDDRRLLRESHQEFGFGYELCIDVRGGIYAHERGASPSDRHLEAQAITWHDLMPELGLVDTAQACLHAGRSTAVEHQDGRHLSQGLDHEHTWHERGTRKVALEELLVDCDVLDRYESDAGLVLDHGVDEQ